MATNIPVKVPYIEPQVDSDNEDEDETSSEEETIISKFKFNMGSDDDSDYTGSEDDVGISNDLKSLLNFRKIQPTPPTFHQKQTPIVGFPQQHRIQPSPVTVPQFTVQLPQVPIVNAPKPVLQLNIKPQMVIPQVPPPPKIAIPQVNLPKVTIPQVTVPLVIPQVVVPTTITVPTVPILGAITPATTKVGGTINIEEILAKMPKLSTIPPIASGSSDINDIIQKQDSEDTDDFEVRKTLTLKLASIPDYKLNNVTAVTVGYMLMHKAKIGFKYDDDIESALSYLTELLKR
jgi:hypothetical protein